MKLKWFFIGLFLTAAFQIFAQGDTAPENWYNLDANTDGYPGVSTEKAYQELLKGKESRTVIVAVIDSGVDPVHEDLKDVMWVNPGEIPNNGKDDDNNGYVDDIYGWNFIGGPDGKNVAEDTYEIVRLYKKYEEQFDGKSEDDISRKERDDYKEYQKIKKIIDAKRDELSGQVGTYTAILEGMKKLKEQVGKDDITPEDLEKLETTDPAIMQAAGILNNVFAQGGTMEDVFSQLEFAVEYFSNQLNYGNNPDFNPRTIVGDDYSDPYQRDYGNNDVKGPDASHGTHVAGIIAASRNNGVGIDGVADNVRIMSVRAVPDGDERDKDVANAIIYAVDNGAQVINMSFGKGYSWDKEAVDKAIKYARKKDVLLVHAAGNSSQNNKTTNNFPNDHYEKRGFFGPKTADNWLEVGALSWQPDEMTPASFSNYSADHVDVFAPGVDILSTTPDGGYERFSGTSMASPVAAGLAALIRSYYPELSASQVRDIIMESTIPVEGKVKKPGASDMVSFDELCQTGGVINAYKALELAAKTKGKKKVKKDASSGSGSGKGTDKEDGQA
jgi:cell wall-associated protease